MSDLPQQPADPPPQPTDPPPQPTDHSLAGDADRPVANFQEISKSQVYKRMKEGIAGDADRPVANFQEISKSQVYKRMKEGNRGDFEPQTIFFVTPQHEVKSIDWQNCLQLKAAIVYHAITGEHVGSDPKTRTQENAKSLFDGIAKICKDKILCKDEIAEQDKALIAPPTAKEQYLEGLIKDAIFLVVGFFSELDKVPEDPARQQIFKDIIKIENQLSLKLISEIFAKVEEAINNTKMKKLLPDNFSGYKLRFQGNFEGAIHRFCRYYSPFDGTVNRLGDDVLKKKENLLHCLHDSLKKAGPCDGYVTGELRRCPSARQLKRSGVRFKASSEATIDVQFSEPELGMPALAYDFKLGTVVRNLMAWECLPSEDQKPVARYFKFINELAGDRSDVRVMKKFGLIKGSWKNLQEVLDLIKRIDGSVTYPCVYMDLDKAIAQVSKYHEKRMQRFFVRNRAAVIWVSSVAAASVIGTAIYAVKKRRG